MKQKPRLTQRELDVMSVLWELGEGSVTEIRERLDPALAYTSVSTMVRLLEMKGYVSHRKGEGKTHIYFPVVDAAEAGESVLDRLLDKIYGGSPLKLLTHLVEQRRFSKEELARMRALLDEAPNQALDRSPSKDGAKKRPERTRRRLG